MNKPSIQLIELAVRIQSLGNSEATSRAVASRAYYAIFHAMSEFHQSLPIRGDGHGASGCHHQLISRLAFPSPDATDADRVTSIALSKTLRYAYDMKIAADYCLDERFPIWEVPAMLSTCLNAVEVVYPMIL